MPFLPSIIVGVQLVSVKALQHRYFTADTCAGSQVLAQKSRREEKKFLVKPCSDLIEWRIRTFYCMKVSFSLKHIPLILSHSLYKVFALFVQSCLTSCRPFGYILAHCLPDIAIQTLVGKSGPIVTLAIRGVRRLSLYKF